MLYSEKKEKETIEDFLFSTTTQLETILQPLKKYLVTMIDIDEKKISSIELDYQKKIISYNYGQIKITFDMFEALASLQRENTVEKLQYELGDPKKGYMSYG
jgi:hypothetical protein